MADWRKFDSTYEDLWLEHGNRRDVAVIKVYRAAIQLMCRPPVVYAPAGTDYMSMSDAINEAILVLRETKRRIEGKDGGKNGGKP